ncbi:class F sortase [Streptacidiphilus fuscans]|uniref:Class F sortase n=1 Tax=Streptacidiphilus fuscans TaxID=2789292 RepID=A0A931FBT5_9ACTN|nr:class F sortase [Streptacidiphilus fuscans]MBF9066470.1 class F sortase [Streptacidiphilus fuscans]
MSTRYAKAWLAVLSLAAVSLASGCGADPSSAVGASTVASSPAAAPLQTPAGAPADGTSAHVLARSTPVRLEIPAIGVDTPVMRLGLDSDGTVQVPPIEANAPAGWYQGSPTPGQLGPSVILAHVTVGQFGNGVFLHLARLRSGDRVTVRLQDGASAAFTVYKVQTVRKAEFPTSEVYGNVDRPELRLITCGGPRDSSGHGYLDNVLVFASLDPGQ